MQKSQYNALVSSREYNTLPPLAGYSSFGSLNGCRDFSGTNSYCSFSSASTMVSQNNRSSSSKSLIYRSIPPKPHTFTLSDMIGDSLIPQKTAQSKKLGLTGSSSSEFAKRFMSRPTTQPKVVEFNVGRVSAHKLRRRGINGFFPPVKLRGSAKTPAQSSQQSETHHVVTMSAPPIPTATTTTTTEPAPAPDTALQLVPTSYSEVRPKSASRSISRASRTSRHSVRKTPESIRTVPPQESNIVYPETFEFDDLSIVPSHKKKLPKRDLPWVFRYKVKRNMNELSKIMANKNPQLVDV